MIIGCHLMGGLANMLWQIAFAESLSKKYGCDVVYTNLNESLDYNKKNYPNRVHADEYLGVFPNIDWTKNRERLGEINRTKHVPYIYSEIIPEDGVEYVGYYQSVKFWYSEEFVRWLLTVETPIDNLTRVCSIHVRRTDYVTMKDVQPALGTDYYQRAIQRMERYGIKKYFIFSDDMEWCRENFKGDLFHFIHGRDYQDLWVMANCQYNIIANSSFSLLSALINPNPGKVIISPLRSKWFGSRVKESTQDLLPDYIIQMP